MGQIEAKAVGGKVDQRDQIVLAAVVRREIVVGDRRRAIGKRILVERNGPGDGPRRGIDELGLVERSN
jgi:hypothetical protein